MGLFDYVKCDYPLGIENQNDISFQSQDTPNQFMDTYVIGSDGCLYYERYDTVDKRDKNAESGTFASIAGMLSRENKRLEKQESFTGEIYFYGGRYEFSAYFVKGLLKHLENLTD